MTWMIRNCNDQVQIGDSSSLAVAAAVVSKVERKDAVESVSVDGERPRQPFHGKLQRQLKDQTMRHWFCL